MNLYLNHIEHIERCTVTRPGSLYVLLQDLQVQLEEETRIQEELREEHSLLERRCALLVSEGEENRTALEATERARKTLETELQEATEKYNDINNQVKPRNQTI